MKTKGLIILSIIGLAITIGIVLNINKPQNNIDQIEQEEERSISDAIAYNNLIKADLETGEINMDYVRNAYAELSKMKKTRSLGIEWNSEGPDNVGGRTRAILVDKDDSKIMYAGGVSGGMFKSTNGGKNWVRKPYASELGGMIVSCIAQSSNGDLYFGTGEIFFTLMSGPDGNLTSGSYGGGIYKSTDRGETWNLLSKTDPYQSGQTMFSNVQDIVVDPKNPQKVYAASWQGLMISEDGGATWNRETLPNTYTNRIIIELEMADDGSVLYAVGWNINDYRAYIFRSKNGGAFERVGDGQVEQYQSRITMAIAPSNPNIVYAVCANPGRLLEGVYKSTDMGDNWTKVVPGGSQAEPFGSSRSQQGQYNNCVAVDPYNENRIFVGGVDFYCLNGNQWLKAGSTTEFTDQNEQFKNPYYIHADKHTIIFDTVSKPARMIIASDGGISVSTDFRNKYPTYQTLNVDLTTTQFYCVAMSLRGDIVGGTQDNGSLRIEYDGLTGKSAQEIQGGDGFYCEISKYDPDMYYTESQYGNVYRSRTKGSDNSSKTKASDVFTNDLGISSDSRNFNTPFRLWENMVDSFYYDSLNNKHDTTMHLSKFFVAIWDQSNTKGGVWMTPNATDFAADTIRWFRISTGMGGFRPQCIEYTENGNTVFVGGSEGSSGYVYRITGLNQANFEFDINGNFDPALNGIKTDMIQQFSSRSVTGIGIYPKNNNVIGVTLGNYVSSTLDHVYICENANDSIPVFKSIQGNLPSFPVYDIAFTEDQDEILLATEFGMFSTSNGGNTWGEENAGMGGRCPVYMIRQLGGERPWHNGYAFYIATHGMGIYSTHSLTNVGQEEVATPKFHNLLTVYPNPVIQNANIVFNANETKGYKIDIYDLSGKVVKHIDLNNQVYIGKNNMSINTNDLKKGAYIIRLSGPEGNQTERFVKM